MKKKIMFSILITIFLTGCGTSSQYKDHIHTYSDTWYFTNEGHFRKCIYSGCEEQSAIAPHTFDEFGVCKKCGYSQDEDADSSSCKHDWTNWEIIEEATCIEAGVRERFCVKCEKIQTREIAIDTEYGHRWIDDPSSDNAATCTTPGITGSQYCSRCFKKKKGVVSELAGHTYERKDNPLAVEPTCENSGLCYYECKLCNCTEYKEVPAYGHSFVSDDGPVAPNGYATLRDSICKKCNRHIIQWSANKVTDNCKNNKRLASNGEYEPNYVEEDDGGIKFWGRPIHNAVDLPSSDSAGTGPNAYNPIYDANIEGSFFEYKFTLENDIANATLVANFIVAEHTQKLFTAADYSFTSGLIDSVDNYYKTRYVISLDGNELEQDLSKDVNVADIKKGSETKWFTFPLKDNLNLTSGTHTLRISMGSGYISTFYDFGLEL